VLFPTSVFALFFFVVFFVHWGLVQLPRTRKWFLLCASMVFYGYWSWKFALLLLGSSMVNHAAARLLACMHDRHGRRRKLLLLLVLVINLGILASFKYAGFFTDGLLLPVLRPVCLWLGEPAIAALINFQESIHPILSSIVLPVGISFFTFQALSYVIDVHRGSVSPARSWLDFANYLAFFPQLVAGPIVRADVLVPQMETLPAGKQHGETGKAAFLIVSGLFKKTVLANWIATRLADPVFAMPETFSGPDILLGVYGYAVQIYCDFSAYSDIAIGTALLMGFKFPDNFNAPYFAASLRDFWRRWHISLSTWLRDYVYIPMGGSRTGPRRTAAALLATFVLGGLWHGASWTFVLWGAFHGVGLIVERFVKNLWHPAWMDGKKAAALIRMLGMVMTFHLVCFSWILFRGGDIDGTMGLLRGLFAWRSGISAVTLWSTTSVLMLATGFASQFLDGERLTGFHARLSRVPAWIHGAVAAVVLTAILGLGPKGVAPFIYFQF
jgi:alginate O-acetyltransferase complex protein AlgI